MIEKAEEFIKDFWGIVDNGCDITGRNISAYDIALVIKQAQLDAIEETVKLCAHEATVDFYTDDDWERVYFVNKDTILNCAEILKKQLE